MEEFGIVGAKLCACSIFVIRSMVTDRVGVVGAFGVFGPRGAVGELDAVDPDLVASRPWNTN